MYSNLYTYQNYPGIEAHPIEIHTGRRAEYWSSKILNPILKHNDNIGINELENLRELVKRNIIKTRIKTQSTTMYKNKLTRLEVGETVLLKSLRIPKY